VSGFLRSGRQWPLILVGILLLAAGANGILVYRATHDPSFAVEPDYYRKALAWDERQAEARRGEALGWALDAELAAGEPTPAIAELRVRLRDRAGQPLRGATVEVAALHKARAARVLRARLEADPAEPGLYRASLPARRRGLWELELRVVRGGDRLTRTVVRELGARAVLGWSER
jgi:nitrogen fixation protein FixH